MENPMKMYDLGEKTLFLETSISHELPKWREPSSSKAEAFMTFMDCLAV